MVYSNTTSLYHENVYFKVIFNRVATIPLYFYIIFSLLFKYEIQNLSEFTRDRHSLSAELGIIFNLKTLISLLDNKNLKLLGVPRVCRSQSSPEVYVDFRKISLINCNKTHPKIKTYEMPIVLSRVNIFTISIFRNNSER